MNYNISKSKAEIYRIRNIENSWFAWADITIDENVESGRISISSDYGNWSYYWSSCGCSFKEFLCGVSIDYVAEKFRESHWFDQEATIQHLKHIIIEQRKQDDLTEEEARSYYNLIETDLEHIQDQTVFEIALHQSELSQIDEWFEVSTNISPSFNQFWENPWQAFISQLKAEKEGMNTSHSISSETVQ